MREIPPAETAGWGGLGVPGIGGRAEASLRQAGPALYNKREDAALKAAALRLNLHGRS